MQAEYAITLLPTLLFLVLILLVGYRARLRDRRECEVWWRGFRDRERRANLDLAYQAGFRRQSNESDDVFITRFFTWLYDEGVPEHV